MKKNGEGLSPLEDRGGFCSFFDKISSISPGSRGVVNTVKALSKPVSHDQGVLLPGHKICFFAQSRLSGDVVPLLLA